MARVFRHSWTKRHADGRREKRVCPKWYIEYTDASGRNRRVPGFTDKAASQQKAADLVKQVERERAGILDAKSIDVSRQLSAAIGGQVAAYVLHLQSAGVSAWHLSETTRRLEAVLKGCGFASLNDIFAEPLQRWCLLRRAEDMSPRTLNTYTGSLRAFVRWALADGRMLEDRLVTFRKADEQADVKRERRALSEAELVRLLDAAERRPLHDARLIRRGPRKGELAAKVKPEVRERLERLGRERRLIYMTLLLTGLRRGELEALRWAHLDFDGGWLNLPASKAKNRKSEPLPLRADLIEELKAWHTEGGKVDGKARVFNVPKQLVNILNRDLKHAGITKTDDDGRTIDVHAIRHTTATHLQKAGVAPKTIQKLMRHSDIRLTLDRYADPALLDTEGAVNSLPNFKGSPTERERATGTCDDGSALALSLGVSQCVSQHKGATSRTHTAKGHPVGGDTQSVMDAQLSNDLHGNSTKRATRLELVTFSLEGCNGSILTDDDTSTYEERLERLASHLVFLLKTDIELRDVLEAWPTLSEPLRAGVLALVRTADKGDRKDKTR